MWPISLDSLKDTYNSMLGNASDSVKPLNIAAPSIATTAGSQKMLKTGKEKKGFTMAGGRRITSRRSRNKKTHKRRH